MRIEAPCQCALTIAAGKATFTTAFCSLRECLQRPAAARRPRPDAPPPIPRSASHPTSPATRPSPPRTRRTRHFCRARRTITTCLHQHLHPTPQLFDQTITPSCSPPPSKIPDPSRQGGRQSLLAHFPSNNNDHHPTSAPF